MSAASDRLSLIFTAVLALCAIVVTALVVRREFTIPAPKVESATPSPRIVEDWVNLTAGAPRIGSREAPVHIIEFFDYQCPFCRNLHRVLSLVRERNSEQVTVIYKHLPLWKIHPRAREAALAAECANDQGKFEAYHDLLFENQKQLFSVRWDSLAERIGIPDLSVFRSCMEEERPAGRIERDVVQAESLGIRSVPTLIINGRVVQGARPLDELEKLVLEAMQSR